MDPSASTARKPVHDLPSSAASPDGGGGGAASAPSTGAGMSGIPNVPFPWSLPETNMPNPAAAALAFAQVRQQFGDSVDLDAALSALPLLQSLHGHGHGAQQSMHVPQSPAESAQGMGYLWGSQVRSPRLIPVWDQALIPEQQFTLPTPPHSLPTSSSMPAQLDIPAMLAAAQAQNNTPAGSAPPQKKKSGTTRYAPIQPKPARPTTKLSASTTTTPPSTTSGSNASRPASPKISRGKQSVPSTPADSSPASTAPPQPLPLPPVNLPRSATANQLPPLSTDPMGMSPVAQYSQQLQMVMRLGAQMAQQGMGGQLSLPMLEGWSEGNNNPNWAALGMQFPGGMNMGPMQPHAFQTPLDSPITPHPGHNPTFQPDFGRSPSLSGLLNEDAFRRSQTRDLGSPLGLESPPPTGTSDRSWMGFDMPSPGTARAGNLSLSFDDMFAGDNSDNDNPENDPLATKVWKLYAREKGSIKHAQRMENLTWRMMALKLKKKEAEEKALLQAQQAQAAEEARSPAAVDKGRSAGVGAKGKGKDREQPGEAASGTVEKGASKGVQGAAHHARAQLSVSGKTSEEPGVAVPSASGSNTNNSFGSMGRKTVDWGDPLERGRSVVKGNPRKKVVGFGVEGEEPSPELVVSVFPYASSKKKLMSPYRM
ncbi:hypothetical protein CALVIDRAFT_257748 [Calocera viscosa TUFC12733]|uniref:Nitrogen regulatory protein areA GATA-like domain-containing protein n=1 Tax=Calocera viscosa (strain TUFC12733) TaxID=1330018 RepID=A0A167JAZ6_CALVF|nr:hypothetical protein CALVIDRAFT_257748 [Calocera viscosa TUFC12733]